MLDFVIDDIHDDNQNLRQTYTVTKVNWHSQDRPRHGPRSAKQSG